jgi:1-deoxy-D-xylulose-5-phosphate synthase
VPVLSLGLPDHFVDHGTREEQMAELGLDGQGILRAVQKRLRAKNLDSAASPVRSSQTS